MVGVAVPPQGGHGGCPCTRGPPSSCPRPSTSRRPTCRTPWATRPPDPRGGLPAVVPAAAPRPRRLPCYGPPARAHDGRGGPQAHGGRAAAAATPWPAALPAERVRRGDPRAAAAAAAAYAGARGARGGGWYRDEDGGAYGAAFPGSAYYEAPRPPAAGTGAPFPRPGPPTTAERPYAPLPQPQQLQQQQQALPPGPPAPRAPRHGHGGRGQGRRRRRAAPAAAWRGAPRGRGLLGGAEQQPQQYGALPPGGPSTGWGGLGAPQIGGGGRGGAGGRGGGYAVGGGMHGGSGAPAPPAGRLSGRRGVAARPRRDPSSARDLSARVRAQSVCVGGVYPLPPPSCGRSLLRPPELAPALEELAPHVDALTNDPFGAAVVIALLSRGSPEQR